MNWSNSSGIHRVDPDADTKDGITIVPGADGGKSWRSAGGNGWVAVGRGSRAALSLDGTLENKNNSAQRDMCEEEKERVRKEEQEKGETPDGVAGL